jgi:hypothetical protein
MDPLDVLPQLHDRGAEFGLDAVGLLEAVLEQLPDELPVFGAAGGGASTHAARA